MACCWIGCCWIDRGNRRSNGEELSWDQGIQQSFRNDCSNNRLPAACPTTRNPIGRNNAPLAPHQSDLRWRIQTAESWGNQTKADDNEVPTAQPLLA